jgi:small GTP-binding protein
MNSNRETDIDHILKLIVIGNSGVGKTNIIKRFKNDDFEMNSRSTVGFEFISKDIIIQDKKIKLQIWDTAGQERYKSITSSFFRGCHGIVAVFDLTKYQSFESIDQWVKDAREISGSEISIFLVGNKSDLRDLCIVKKEEAEEKINKLGLIEYIETSAYMNIRIDEIFMKLSTSNIPYIYSIFYPY